MAVNFRYELALSTFRAMSKEQRAKEVQAFVRYAGERYPELLPEFEDAAHTVLMEMAGK